MSAKINRSRIMKAAHFTARWRVATVGGSYREWLAKALAHEWKQAKDRAARREWDKASFLDCALGLPIRSCPADAANQPNVFTGLRSASRLFTHHSGGLAGQWGA